MNLGGSGQRMSVHWWACQCVKSRMVISGRAVAAMEDGTTYELAPGDLFAIAPGHDSWVIGEEPYISLHFLGAEDYAH